MSVGHCKRIPRHGPQHRAGRLAARSQHDCAQYPATCRTLPKSHSLLAWLDMSGRAITIDGCTMQSWNLPGTFSGMHLTACCGVQTMGCGKTLQVHPPRLTMCIRLLPYVRRMLNARRHPPRGRRLSSCSVVQSIILALLFMAVRAKQHEHARVVIVVPTNVQLNWMDELERWLREFTTSGVTRTEGQLTLVRPPPRLPAPTAVPGAATGLPEGVCAHTSVSQPVWLLQWCKR